MQEKYEIEGDEIAHHFMDKVNQKDFIYEVFKVIPESICVVDGETYGVVGGTDKYLKGVNLHRDQINNKTVGAKFRLKNEEAKIKLYKELILHGAIDNLVCDAYAEAKGHFKIEISGRRFYYKNRAFIVLINRDVTARYDHKRKILNDYISLSEVENLVDYSGCVLCRWKNETGFPIDYISDNIRNFGFVPEQFYEDPGFFEELLHPNDVEKSIMRITRMAVINSGRSFHDTSFRLKRKDGHFIWVKARCWHLTDKLGNITHIQAILKRITPEFPEDAEEIRTQGLESLGILAGGIAHDFNNLLAAIWGRISVARSILKNNDKAVRMLSGAEDALEQAKDLTQQLLTFSKGGKPIKKKVEMKDLVRNRVDFCVRGSEVVPFYKMPKNKIYAEVDMHQINQVVNNLVVNAIQAMNGRGQLIVKLEEISSMSDPNIFEYNGQFLKMTINDFGVGIPEYELQRVFEPYYSTKEKGSGLGLTICRSIVEKHNGKLVIESSLGVGTLATMYLPLSRGLREGEMLEETTNMKQKKGRILIMDDDEMVRGFLEDALMELGYDVIATADGQEALEAYKKAMDNNDKIDVTIMDLTIPGGMGGQETIGHLKKLDPSAKALVSSGYSNDLVMSEYEKFGFSGVMIKPYNLEQLNDSLEQVLN